LQVYKCLITGYKHQQSTKILSSFIVIFKGTSSFHNSVPSVK